MLDFHFEERDPINQKFVIEIELRNRTGREIAAIEGVVRVIRREDSEPMKTIFLSHDQRIQPESTAVLGTKAQFVFRDENEIELKETGFTSLEFLWETASIRYSTVG